uniref:Uncharacterized protein n=1 Tax=Arundo donax TaxID=35708 RepID=A0A0A9FQ20_ARUDO
MVPKASMINSPELCEAAYHLTSLARSGYNLDSSLNSLLTNVALAWSSSSNWPPPSSSLPELTSPSFTIGTELSSHPSTSSASAPVGASVCSPPPLPSSGMTWLLLLALRRLLRGVNETPWVSQVSLCESPLPQTFSHNSNSRRPWSSVGQPWERTLPCRPLSFRILLASLSSSASLLSKLAARAAKRSDASSSAPSWVWACSARAVRIRSSSSIDHERPAAGFLSRLVESGSLTDETFLSGRISPELLAAPSCSCGGEVLPASLSRLDLVGNLADGLALFLGRFGTGDAAPRLSCCGDAAVSPDGLLLLRGVAVLSAPGSVTGRGSSDSSSASPECCSLSCGGEGFVLTRFGRGDEAPLLLRGEDAATTSTGGGSVSADASPESSWVRSSETSPDGSLFFG